MSYRVGRYSNLESQSVPLGTLGSDRFATVRRTISNRRKRQVNYKVFEEEKSSLPFASKISGYYIENYDASLLLNSILGCCKCKGSVFDINILKSVVVYNTFGVLYAIGLIYLSSMFRQFKGSEALVFTSLASFLISTYTATIFHRWWGMRIDLQTIVGNLTTFLFIFKSSLMNTKNFTHRQRIRTARRWCVLAHHMLWLSVNEREFDEFCDGLMHEGFLLPDEKEKLETSDASNAVIVYSWLFDLIGEHARSLPQGKRVYTVHYEEYCMNCLQTAFGKSSAIVMTVKQQIPYAFAHLLTIVIRVHLLCFAFYGGGRIARGIQHKSWEIFWGMLMTTFNTIIFTGLFNIHITLENPMNGDPNDFSWEHFDKLIKVNTALSVDEEANVVLTVDDVEREKETQPSGMRRLLSAGEKAIPEADQEESFEVGNDEEIALATA